MSFLATGPLIVVGIENLIECRGYLEKGLEDPGIEMFRHGPAVALGNDLKRLFVVERRFVRPLAA
jgi:hypothetical protein